MCPVTILPIAILDHDPLGLWFFLSSYFGSAYLFFHLSTALCTTGERNRPTAHPLTLPHPQNILLNELVKACCKHENCLKESGECMEQTAAEIVPCPRCGVKNRIPREKIDSQARCGKCSALLQSEGKSNNGLASYLFRCPECRVRNRILSDKIDSNPVCGRCKKPLKTEELFLPQPIVITDGNFESRVSRSPLPVLVFAWAPWCPTCTAFLPVIGDFARESKGKVRVGKLNVDENPGLSSTFSILSVPQILIFDGGELKETLPGAMQKHEIMMKMARYL